MGAAAAAGADHRQARRPFFSSQSSSSPVVCGVNSAVQVQLPMLAVQFLRLFTKAVAIGRRSYSRRLAIHISSTTYSNVSYSSGSGSASQEHFCD